MLHEFQKDFGLVDKPYKEKNKLKYGKLYKLNVRRYNILYEFWG
jgi:hypothetical protein